MGRRWLLLASAVLIGCGNGAEEPAIADPDAAAGGTDAAVPLEDGGALAQVDADASIPLAMDGGVFADDFEDGDLKNNWDVLNVCSGCSATIDQGAFLAKTQSLLVQETAFSFLRTTVPGTPSRVRLSFLATFPSVTLTQGTLAIASVDISTSHFFSLFFRDDDINAPAPSLEETSTAGTNRHHLLNLPPAGVPTRIVIDLDIGAGTANVAWGATVALANEPIEKTPAAKDPTIRVGLMYVYGPEDAFEGRFDDVLLEYY
jgi:hypothetical protein